MAKVVVNASGGNLQSHASNGALAVITTPAKHADGSNEKDTRN